MTSECEPLPLWKWLLLAPARRLVVVADAVVEFTVGFGGFGRLGEPDKPGSPPRRKLYGYLYSHEVPSNFKARARDNRAWNDGGLFRLGTTERQVLVSRTGWVVSGVELGRSRRWLGWTFRAICVDGECLTLVARSGTAERWSHVDLPLGVVQRVVPGND
jgi:hypothetical protein